MKKILTLMVLIITAVVTLAIDESFIYILVKHETPTEARQTWVDYINGNMGFTNNPITLSMFENMPLTNSVGDAWDRSVWYRADVSDKFTSEKINEIQTLIGTNLIRIMKTNQPNDLDKELGLFNVTTNNIN